MRSVQDLQSLNGMVSLVTGGGGNMGLAFCEALAELGSEICVLDINSEKAESRAEYIKDKYGVKTSHLVVDISSEKCVKLAVEELIEIHKRLDILVNNAAYSPSQLPPDGFSLIEQNLQQWEAQLDVILKGTFLMCKHCMSELSVHKNGRIINISSIYGAVGPVPRLYEGTPMVNEAHYAAAKGGVIQLTRYLASTMAPIVRVNCIAPGGLQASQPKSFKNKYIESTPMCRMAEPEDMKGAMAFLASDLSAYVTGQVLFVDGGWTVW
jgi:NAD(P)-dependent dehydrogenase (short-subunit alcohol dehydrogenase family)